jgi:hypothetical protein
MVYFFNLIFLMLLSMQVKALEYSKIEFPGCPENAYCQKNTGLVRQKWLDQLELFNKNKISLQHFNNFIQESDGLPISNWATEDASIIPRIIMWDSPCPQHKKEATKYYISEVFRKNLKLTELDSLNSVFFSKAYLLGPKEKVISFAVPRGEFPLFSENESYYFLKEDEGKYYGLFIGIKGEVKVTSLSTSSETIKESVCHKNQIDQFLREAPSPSFFQGYTCKSIWDKTSKSYKSLLFGWSCH